MRASIAVAVSGQRGRLGERARVRAWLPANFPTAARSASPTRLDRDRVILPCHMVEINHRGRAASSRTSKRMGGKRRGGELSGIDESRVVLRVYMRDRLDSAGRRYLWVARLAVAITRRAGFSSSGPWRCVAAA